MLKRIAVLVSVGVLILKAGTVTFAGVQMNTLSYNGKESVTISEFASKTGSKYNWIPEKKKAGLSYNGKNYIFTAANRTVVIGQGAIHLPDPIGWDGTNLYIPVRLLGRIFNASPSQVTPSNEIKIEKIELSGTDPTTLRILAAGPISCDVIENSLTSVTLKFPMGSKIKTITPLGLVSEAVLSNNNNKTTINLKLSKNSSVSSKGIPNGVEVTFASQAQTVVQPVTLVTPATPKRKLLIVIDPGHGGKDPGAIGTRGTKEAAMNLDVATRLKSLLEAQGHTVVMTRTSDLYVSLDGRTKFANQKKADLFISIHFNANNSSSINGFESYFLGMHRLEYAKSVALAENSALKYDIEHKAYNPDAVLNDIIGSLLTNSFQKQSETLAGYVQETSSSSSGFANRGVNQAGFYVLKGCSMPSVLIECGFLTNPTEEAKIRQPDYRQRIAKGIAGGVATYVQNL